MPLIGTACQRLDTQGYVHVPQDQLATLEPWLRWSPALCTAVMAIGTLLGSQWVLWGLVPFAALGTIADRHPFDYLYNYGVRHLTGTAPLPPQGAPRRFACGIASVWLIATGVLFAADLATAGYVMGGLLTAVALLVSVTHFCIPSLIYGLLFGRPTRSTEPS